MSTPVAELTPCLCGCGSMVRGEWKRGHASRGVGGYQGPALDLLPGPDDPIGDELPDGIEEALLDPEPEPPPAPERTEEIDWDELQAKPPSWAGDKTKPPKTGTKRKAPPRVTAAVRSDIEAKFGLMLQIPGRIWAARDPYCGGAFLDAEPDIRAAGLDLIMQSPDLIAFFTSTAGGFMLWLNLIVACQPVAFAVWAHHIVHAVESGEPEQERQYAA